MKVQIHFHFHHTRHWLLLRHKFQPHTKSDIEYNNANKFIYSVLVIKVHTNTGKAALQMLESTQNGYKTFSKIKEFNQDNTDMKTTYTTDDNMEKYPHISFTSNETWDPTAFDDPGEFDNAPLDMVTNLSTPIVNDYEDPLVDHSSQVCWKAHIANKASDLDKLQLCLGWSPLDRVKRTLDATTQYSRAV